MEPSASEKTLYDAVMSVDRWTQTIVAFHLPPGLDIVMGDICGGASSTSMARQVLRWRQDSPEEAALLWSALGSANRDIVTAMFALCEEAKVCD